MDSRAGWNEGADAWRTFIDSGADYYRLQVHGPALLARCLPFARLRVLDLGCGEGYFSRELARAGARVAAVDLSDALLRFAREREDAEPFGIDYRHMDAREIADAWDAGSFDLVAACMSLQDMDGADDVLAAASRVLRPAGRMTFSVPHPGSDTPVREWDRGPAGEHDGAEPAGGGARVLDRRVHPLQSGRDRGAMAGCRGARRRRQIEWWKGLQSYFLTGADVAA